MGGLGVEAGHGTVVPHGPGTVGFLGDSPQGPTLTPPPTPSASVRLEDKGPDDGRASSVPDPTPGVYLTQESRFTRPLSVRNPVSVTGWSCVGRGCPGPGRLSPPHRSITHLGSE